MPELLLSRLFRPEHVLAIADRTLDRGWEVLHSAEFQAGVKNLEEQKLKGEANTREKVIEPILYKILGYERNENDSEHAIRFAGAGGSTGNVEYFFRITENTVPVEAEPWNKSLDAKDNSGRSPVRQAFDYATLSNSRWFIVSNGREWRLYKKELKGSESPLSACEQYDLLEMMDDRDAFRRFHATFGRHAFITNTDGVCKLDELRLNKDRWQESISETLYERLVDGRLELFREIQPQVPSLSQEQVNDAVVKLLFRILFILFGEHTPLLPPDFLDQHLIERFEADRKWGMNRSLYSYIQQYFAWLDGREGNGFGIYSYDGALFDRDPVLDEPALRIADELLQAAINKLSKEPSGARIDYGQINPRILGNIYEQFLSYVIEIKAGRIHPHADRDTRRKEGTFYTPESVTKYLVEHCVEQTLRENPGRKPWELRCLDASCGSGHFLVEYVNRVARLSEELDDSRSYPQWKRYITEHCVFGVDKDRTAVMLTKQSLWINSAMKDEPFAVIDTHIKCGNSLVFGEPPDFSLMDYEKQHYPEKHRELKRLRQELLDLEGRTEKGEFLTALERQELNRQIRHALLGIEDLKTPVTQEFSTTLQAEWPSLQQTVPLHWRVEFGEVFDEHGGFHVMVGNPPWGAYLSDIADYIQGGAFQLAHGQYDSYELFIELGRRLLTRNGAFGFIVPDSITLPEHEPLRRMLLENTTLTGLVRLGEGLFRGVYRAAFLLCFVNRPPEAAHVVRVGTLRKADRKLLEQDTLYERLRTIADVVSEGGHNQEQSKFLANARLEFDILTTSRDEPIVSTIDADALNWPTITTTGRGVEMTKKGDVLQCPYCYRWDNVPKKSKGEFLPKTCRHCARTFSIDEAARRERIVQEQPHGDTWKPFIIGESVNRYQISHRLWMDTAKDGINYKSESFYEGRRLLVRKTGVGIMATIDDSGAYTNQVVFTWKLRRHLEANLAGYRLEYLLGVLNSRLMLYRLYAKSGDTEWRSFPYLTQKTIQQLPIRAIDFSNPVQKTLHDEIADRVERIIWSAPRFLVHPKWESH